MKKKQVKSQAAKSLEKLKKPQHPPALDDLILWLWWVQMAESEWKQLFVMHSITPKGKRKVEKVVGIQSCLEERETLIFFHSQQLSVTRTVRAKANDPGSQAASSYAHRFQSKWRGAN